MTIDAKELIEAISELRLWNRNGTFGENRARDMVCDAASAYAATLPREVEIAIWARVDAAGDVQGISSDAAHIDKNIAHYGGVRVRLTGTAVLPRVKD